MLAQEDIDAEFPSLKFDPDESGLVDNAEAAEGTYDPDDAGSDIADAGRITGYNHTFADVQALFGGGDGDPVIVSTEIHVLGDEHSAAEFLDMLATEPMQFEGVEEEGVTLLSVTPVVPDVALGGESRGYQGQLEVFGASFSIYAVYWRRGSAVLGIGYAYVGGAGSDPGAAVQRLVIRMDDRVGPALAGEITAVLPLAPETDRAALVAIYNATDGPNWTNNHNWLTDAPVGEWHGVFTDVNGRVTGLVLTWNELTGKIPPEVGNLDRLEELSFWGNELSGEIPQELVSLGNLKRLDLGDNQLTGQISASLGGLTNLWDLSLGGNQLTGQIPPELGSITNLIQLNLSSNQLSGCVPNSLQDRLDMGISDLGGLPFCSDAASIAPTPIPASTSQSGNGKYDADGDGLIEISNLEQLNAVRYDLNGDGTLDWASGYSGYYDAFPIGATEAVCHNCNGFELTRSLNFKEADSYASGAVNTQWTVGSGWEPTGNSEARFLAIFDGNGHTISNVYIFRIADSHYGNAVGLFGYIGSTSLISKVGLLDVDLTGLNNVGGLVGEGSGTIRDCYTTGRVSGKEHVGGLVGRNDGTITESHSSANVSGSKEWPDEHVGGLTGFNSGTISDSYATGTVSGHYNVGGLVGSNGGRSSAIKGSYATGSVSGQDYVGGLTGISHGSIDVSYATGNVLGANDVGGLAAINYGTISRSYSTGRIEAYFNAGGLVGENSGTITASYTMSSVSSSGVNIGGEHTSGIGGLAGFNEGAIRASYAVGSVSGRGVTVGGLIGANGPSGTIIASYATGRALSSGEHEYVGGLIGSNSGEVTAGFWDTQTSGNETAVGYGESTGTGGKITSELQSPPGYTGIYSDWEEAGDFWDFGTSSQYPALEVDFDGDGAATWQEFGKQRSRAIPSPTSSQGGTLETTPEPLAASFPASPFQSARHKGDDDRPQVIVAFNRPVRSFGKDTPSVSVAGAVVSGVHRHQEGGLENAWLFFLDPAGTGEIRFALVVGRSCDGGGICTKEGNILEVAPEARTLSGPGPDE